MAIFEPVIAPIISTPRIGLVVSAATARDVALRWEVGIEYVPETCAEGTIHDPCESDTLTFTRPTTDNVKFTPFEIDVTDKCSSIGFNSRDWEARGRRQLEAQTSFLIEREFWTGTLAKASSWDNAYLASPESDVLNLDNDAVTPLRAMECLEEGLAQNGGARGMIHAPRSIVTLWNHLGLVERQGNLVLTINDTIVVPGAGYDGSGPDGQAAAASSIWVYGTGLVDVRLGAIDVAGGPNAQGLDRTNNDIIIRASRMAAATFDPCIHLAVEIAATPCGIGGS